jgi:hypothetical protein
MKRHPLQTNPNYTFVCVSDITEEFREHNDVLYNPGLPYDKRRTMFLNMFQKISTTHPISHLQMLMPSAMKFTT